MARPTRGCGTARLDRALGRPGACGARPRGGEALGPVGRVGQPEAGEIEADDPAEQRAEGRPWRGTTDTRACSPTALCRIDVPTIDADGRRARETDPFGDGRIGGIDVGDLGAGRDLGDHLLEHLTSHRVVGAALEPKELDLLGQRRSSVASSRSTLRFAAAARASRVSTCGTGWSQTRMRSSRKRSGSRTPRAMGTPSRRNSPPTCGRGNGGG